jgi:transposase
LDANPTFGVFFMAKYTEQFKLSVITDVESDTGDSLRAVARRHGIDEATLRKWLAAYRALGAAGIQRKHEYYTAPFKRSVLEQMGLAGLSDREAAARFNIRNRSVIGLWRRQYDEGGLAALSARPRERSRNMATALPPKPNEVSIPDERSREELLKENEYLRAEVAYLKKLDALLQAKKRAAQKKKRK